MGGHVPFRNAPPEMFALRQDPDPRHVFQLVRQLNKNFPHVQNQIQPIFSLIYTLIKMSLTAYYPSVINKLKVSHYLSN